MIIQLLHDQATPRQCGMVIPVYTTKFKPNKNKYVDPDVYVVTTTKLCTNKATHLTYTESDKPNKNGQRTIDYSTRQFRCQDHLPHRKMPTVIDKNLGPLEFFEPAQNIPGITG